MFSRLLVSVFLMFSELELFIDFRISVQISKSSSLSIKPSSSCSVEIFCNSILESFCIWFINTSFKYIGSSSVLCISHVLNSLVRLIFNDQINIGATVSSLSDWSFLIRTGNPNPKVFTPRSDSISFV